jgi:hypothetical protein
MQWFPGIRLVKCVNAKDGTLMRLDRASYVRARLGSSMGNVIFAPLSIRTLRLTTVPLNEFDARAVTVWRRHLKRVRDRSRATLPTAGVG